MAVAQRVDDNTRDPDGIIPTSGGGVAAEWHVGGIDLETEVGADRTIEYNFAGLGFEEYEGPVDPDLIQIKGHVGMLPVRAN